MKQFLKFKKDRKTLTMSETFASKGNPRMRTITSPPFVKNTVAA